MKNIVTLLLLSIGPFQLFGSFSDKEFDFSKNIRSDTILYLPDSLELTIDRAIKIDNIKNLTIIGNGSKLIFNFDGKGIDITNCENITIRNLIIDNNNSTTFSGNTLGRVHVENSTKINLLNLTILKQKISGGNRHHQIQIKSSKNCTVNNCTVYGAEGELINLSGSSDCVVSRNRTYGGASGIGTEGYKSTNEEFHLGYRNYIYKNDVFNSIAAMITVNDIGTIVEDNNITSTIIREGKHIGGPGIRFGHVGKKGEYLPYLTALNCKAINNTISNLEEGFFHFKPTGIKIDATSAPDQTSVSLIEGNLIVNCNKGIEISNAQNQKGTIANNCFVSAREIGISLFVTDSLKGHDFEISQNTFFQNNNTKAIYVQHSKVNILRNEIYYSEPADSLTTAIEISKNKLMDSLVIDANKLIMKGGIGIKNKEFTHTVSNASIVNNTISNSHYGIYLTNLSNSSISGNHILRAQKNAIKLGMHDPNNFQRVKNIKIDFNTISSYVSSPIFLHNTKNIDFKKNEFSRLSDKSNQQRVLEKGVNTSVNIENE